MAKRHSSTDPCTIYFIQVVTEEREGPIKIGRTWGNVLDRLDAIRTGCPEVLQIRATIEAAPPVLERAIHQRFARPLLNGDDGTAFLYQFLHQPRQIGYLRSTEDHIQRWDRLEEFFGFGLGQASPHRQLHIGVGLLERTQGVEPPHRAVGGGSTHRARGYDDQIGFFGRLGFGHTQSQQGGIHRLAVVVVHLTAVRFDVDRR